MGLASYSEDIWNRWAEARDRLPDVATPPLYPCPFCHLAFNQEAERLDHLAERHRGESPELFLAGRRAGLEDKVRERLLPGQIRLSNCTGALVSVNGGSVFAIPVKAVATTIARQTNALIWLELQNRYDERAIPARSRFKLRINIPSSRRLRETDSLFRQILSTTELSWNVISEFRRRLAIDGSDSYGHAVADYVQGVLVRDQIEGTVVDRRQYQEAFNSALDELKSYNRPLARVIASIVRFSANDFSHAHEPSGWPQLDLATSILAPLAGRIALTQDSAANKHTRMISLCPTDHGIDTVLDLCLQLGQKTRWTIHLNEEIAARAGTSQLDPLDRSKMLALWAYYALLLGAPAPAAVPLRDLVGDPSFGPWAITKLQELDT